MESSVLLHVTFIEDSICDPQGLCVYFWGVEHKMYLIMKNYIKSIQLSLEKKPPRLNAKKLDINQQDIYFVQVNSEWQRVKVSQPKQDLDGSLEVFCIDTGSRHVISDKKDLRTVEKTDSAADDIHQWPPLASRFVLADLVRLLRDTGSHWSLRELAICGAKMNNRTWTAVPLDFVNGYQSARLFDATNQPLINLLASMSAASDFSSTLSPKTTAPAPYPVLQGNPTTITQIPGVDCTAEENLFVTFSEKPGSFFGKLEKIPVEAKDEMATELLKVYSSLPNPPFLYVDDKSRLGHYGVLQWNEDNYNCFHRVLVTSELANDVVKVYFIDHGQSVLTSRFKILAPLDCLNHFHQPPHGILCKLDLNFSLDVSDWNKFILDKRVKVKVGECVEGIYVVTFVDDSIDKELANKVLPKALSTSTVMDNFTVPTSTRNSVPLVLQMSSSLPIVLENELPRNYLFKYPPQNTDFVPEQIISTHAIVPYFNSFSEFWIQLEPQLVTTIMERIDSLILDPKFSNQNDISANIGKPCLAFYPLDGKWHRAIVKDLNGDWITVCYVDYGISYILRTSHLRELPQDLIKLPALAFKCCLDGFCLNGSEFLSKVVTDVLKDRFLKSATFGVQFWKVVDGVLHIRLRHVQTMGPNHLNRLLENP